MDIFRDIDKLISINYSKDIKFISNNKKLKIIIKKFILLIIILISFIILTSIFYTFKKNNISLKLNIIKFKNLFNKNEREQWVDLAYRISAPVLENMSKGLLHKNMIIEYSPIYNNGNKEILYMECFGRLMDGISPWLSLPEDDTKEGKIRKKLLNWALLSYKNAVDPNNPDYLLWDDNNSQQRLVDAAYLAESFLRAPEATWEKLDQITKKRYIDCFKKIRNIEPYNNNWLLFRGIIECFFILAGEVPDKQKMFEITSTINKWYIGDGWYSDGPIFAMNYYNSFDIHPMLIHILEIMEKNNIKVPISSNLALQRMQRFNIFMERLISPEGYFPVFGRSIIYRMAVFQTLALSSWKYGLPEPLTYGCIRNALTTIMNNMYNNKGNFNKGGYLTLGFSGHQYNASNHYSNNGSAYITSLVFLPLGLSSNHPFWKDKAKSWTSQNAWSGRQFPIDNHVNLKKL